MTWHWILLHSPNGLWTGRISTFMLKEKRPHPWLSDIYAIGSFLFRPDSTDPYTYFLFLFFFTYFSVFFMHIFILNQICNISDSTTADVMLLYTSSKIFRWGSIRLSISKHTFVTLSHFCSSIECSLVLGLINKRCFFF
jgi:hypothetical protein